VSTKNGAPAAKKAAARARKTEAAEDPEPISFEHNGVRYVIAPDALDDLELMENLEDEKYFAAVRGFVGAEQWATFKATNRNEDGRVPASAAEPFLDKLLEVIGKGNSSASSTS
jgi:hypothetical protein